MPSASWNVWVNDRIARLNEIEAQCASCQLAIPNNVPLTEENLRGYILLLSAHFQGFCRDLYSECALIIASKVRPSLRPIIQEQFTGGRALDHGNPNIENIKKDFNRFGFRLDMGRYDLTNEPRLAELKKLNEWRNIAAHHGVIPPTGLPTLTVVQNWRNSCAGLATSLDGILYNQLRVVLRRPPWTP